MTSITLGFEVHQPYRVRRDFFWKRSMYRNVEPEDLFNYYFSPRNKEIFEKVASKCYYPTNEVLLDNIDRYKGGSKNFKCSFSLSGIILEQMERYDQDLLETFVQLNKTGHVEFLDQTYHHSLFSLYDDPSLFIEDVLKHRQTMNDLLGIEPRVFENTEFLYNNRIASIVGDLGYDCIFTEGMEHITGGRSPNHVFRAKEQEIRVLLRNYKITDDVGFRFSSRDWEEFPLTAEKYSSWLASTPGECINIFMDYETFGEHQWKETGIFDFLYHLPDEVFKWDHLDFRTPTETISIYEPVGEVDVYELGGTVSWADLERDTSCWLGNSMQWAAYTYHKQIRPLKGDPLFQKIWGYLSTSDHLYYMFTAGGGPGEVHSYFSPFENPSNAFLNYLAVLFDFHFRTKGESVEANDPFIFSNEKGDIKGVAFGKIDFSELINNVDIDSIKFHMKRNDFHNWITHSLADPELAKKISQLKYDKLNDKKLRKNILKALNL